MGLYVDANESQRDIGAETRDTLRAQIDLAPDQAAAYASTLPLYTLANNRAVYDALMGTKGGTRTEEYIDNQTRPASTLGIAEANQRGLVERVGGNYWSPVYGLTEAGRNEGYTLHNDGNAISRPASTMPVLRTRTISGVETPGLLSLYENEIAPVMNRTQAEAQRQQVEQNQALLSQYGPGYIAAMKAVNPEQTALRDTLYAQTRDDLALGGALDAGTRREIEQSTQGRWSSALAYSPEVAAATRMGIGSAAEARRRQRQDAAMRIIGLDQSLYGDPFLQITGRPSGTASAAQNFLYQGQGTTAQNQAATRAQFDPFNSYASQLYGQNSSQMYDAQKTNSGIMGGIIGGGMNLVGSLGSSAFGAAGKAGGFGKLFS